MKKLTAFLEEEREKFNLQFCENYDWWITDEEPEAKPSLVKEWLKDHDTRLINFILDTVMEEIKKEEKEKWVKVFDYHNDMSNERHSAMRNVARTEINYWKNYKPTIINNLKVK